MIVTSRSATARVTAGLRRAGFRDVRPVGHVARGDGVRVPDAGLEFSGYA